MEVIGTPSAQGRSIDIDLTIRSTTYLGERNVLVVDPGNAVNARPIFHVSSSVTTMAVKSGVWNLVAVTLDKEGSTMEFSLLRTTFVPQSK